MLATTSGHPCKQASLAKTTASKQLVCLLFRPIPETGLGASRRKVGQRAGSGGRVMAGTLGRCVGM